MNNQSTPSKEDFKKLEKRLANTEKALVALIALASFDNENPVHDMVADYFNANESLGADFTTDENLPLFESE